ncbi:hypothetical protein BDL97_10G085900 [Sphagnum fallax]|nr:hypothetical protein BDL97_10G085900 [Sphagnum fallax]
MRITYYARRTERASIVQDAVLMEDLSVEVRGIEKYWILNGSSLLNLRPAPSNADPIGTQTPRGWKASRLAPPANLYLRIFPLHFGNNAAAIL